MTTTSTSAATTDANGIVQDVTPRQVSEWLHAGGAVLIDVRESDEHVRERIAGARSLPLSRFDPHVAASYAKPGQRLIMHCRGGRRSQDAARMMAASRAGAGIGLSIRVMCMSGGIEAWKKDNLPVDVAADVDVAANPISMLRQVQLVTGALVFVGSALAWFVHPGFVGIPAFMGFGLMFAGASGMCALPSILAAMPWNARVDGQASCSGE